jgi:hypothetical protein
MKTCYIQNRLSCFAFEGFMPAPGTIPPVEPNQIVSHMTINRNVFLMRILTPSLALVLGLALAPAAAMAQAANSSVAPSSPSVGVTSSAPVTTAGSGANNSKPVGGPAVTGQAHKKYHKRSHHKFYGKHHDYTKTSPAKGPAGPVFKQTGTN